MAGIGLIAAMCACVPVGSPTATPTVTPGVSLLPFPTPDSIAGPFTMLAAGDIADCNSTGDEATAALLDELIAEHGGTVLALGDLAYKSGTVDEFANCYDPTWGRHKGRTIPTPGNHEYETPGAAGYFDYFGDYGGVPDASWNVFEFGSWHIVALNSNCDEIGGCGPGSPQAQWLADSMPSISPFPGRCTLAFWHHPRWSSGVEHGSDPQTDTLWRMLYEGGVDLVLTGHDHEYERFAPMDADGKAVPNGMVEFVVGTGGRSLYEFAEILPTSAAHDNTTYGVLKLTLHRASYDWEFVPASESAFTDAGTASCR